MLLCLVALGCGTKRAAPAAGAPCGDAAGRRSMSTDPAQCQTLRFVCEAGEEAYFDACGCGCAPAPAAAP